MKGIASASVGALSGVFITYMGIDGLLSLLLSFILSFLMIFICIGKGIRFINYLKYTMVLWGIGAMLAGGVSLICTLGDVDASSFSMKNGASALFVLILSVFVVRFILKAVIVTPKPKECILELRCFGIKAKASVLIDSGNLIIEQLSGLPVVFVKRSIFPKNSLSGDVELLCQGIEAMEKLTPDTKRRARVVSVKRVGESKLLVGIVTSELYIINEGQRINVKAVMVIENVADYGGYDGIVPQSLVF